MYIVIRAGGVGTRLWPVSRTAKPKQLHALTGTDTLLQMSIDRVLDMEAPDHIYVSCSKTTEKNLKEELVGIPDENVIIEPALRDTTAAVGLETIIIAKKDPTAVIASLGSDHVITDKAEFQRILKLAEKVINDKPDHILCIGIAPDAPDTGYGYIELGAETEAEVYEVKSFKEKPDQDTAQEFVHAGNYLWNANMFVWRADTVLDLFKEHQPEMYKQLMSIQDDPSSLETEYPKLEKVAIDYAIIEKTSKILAVPGKFGWNDIGDWSRLKDELSNSNESHVNAEHLDIDSQNILIHSNTDRLIATIGLKDIIIVDTDDALLVCDKSQSQEVKKIVEELKKGNKKHLL
ncbi:MAG: sugar phosphate nucleotidyltransferase [bacterium]|nr:sugar phosphate nucleotidyltransferase [bacterium]